MIMPGPDDDSVRSTGGQVDGNHLCMLSISNSVDLG